jgi:hypothetical protein
MLTFPELCLKFDEKISLLSFQNKGLNELKESILLQVSKQSDINAQILQETLISEGFTVQIKKILETNYSSRLNLNNNYNYLCNVFEELLSLVSLKKI